MDKIKTVAIYANQKRDEGGKFTSLIARAAMLRGINVRLLARQVGDVSGADLCGSEDELLDGADALITLGGDGTVLEMCSHAASHGVPMLGINLGHLGFLTGLECDGADRVSELFD